MSKASSLTVLVLAEIAAMSVWFASAAVVGDMARETEISRVAQALLSSGVQAGFAIGALAYAVLGLADRFDPRRVFAASALAAAAANATLLIAPVGGSAAIVARFLTGAFLAGVYPVGMKIAVGWGARDRGMLVGLLVGALTLGSAAPHLLAFWGGSDWRAAIGASSVLAAIAGALALCVGLGPHHARAPAFSARALGRAWSDRRIRLAYAGYLGHMWELYAMWAWIGVALAAAFAARMPETEAAALAKATAFGVIAMGAVSSVIAGVLADRIGKAEVATLAMLGSGAMAVVAALSFSAPPAALIVAALLRGSFVVADSAQFSALVADYAPPEETGALLTLQTALGFALTVLTVQATPFLAGAIGWPLTFAAMAIGPALGILAMRGLWRERSKAEF